MMKIIFFVIILMGLKLSEGVIVKSPIVFYDLKTKEPLEAPITTILPGSENDSFNMSSVINIRLPFIGQPCGCISFNCGCCAGMMMEQFNIDQKMCMNFTYDPMEFAIIMDMNMNENNIYTNMVSGKNPPPLCIPVPTGPLPLGMEMCIKVFNIFMPGNNLHMCMDVMAKFQMTPILILHFDCMRFGQDQIAILKPEDNGGLMTEETESESDGVGEMKDDQMMVEDNKTRNSIKNLNNE
ncbi:CLUMA_CG003961, isoform A [Clunio marinus]|uniref:CLUMA_CG003961, isoform A n=1 Tax=Clunio marinus TaxID=568069 RepID=A0A1J1HRU7_9DIPT|nr:CLUMA_CG003961, isoform A [Clunio marinus]